MKSIIRSVALFFLIALVFSGTPGRAQPEPADQTLSPYFFVKSDDPETDRLPLKTTNVDVNIAGVIADVRVSQVYTNEGKHPLEAVYVFPASTRAAVYAMKMTIGKRTIVAKIKKRDEARQEYEEAKQQGKSASLLEQQRPNVFQMNVANIMPGDEVKVEMSYTELLVPTDKEYEFLYPTVVGPRYSNQPAATAPASEHWVENPYLHQGEAPTHTFAITVKIAAGLPIQRVASPSHKVDLRFDGNTGATITLDKNESRGGNRDFILRYRLAGGQIEAGLLLSRGEKENFFLLMLQPPRRVKLAEIPGREYVFVVDVSGSMHGYPLDISKKLLKDLIGNLRPTDTFNLLLFAGGNSVLSERSLPATSENITRALAMIDREQGGGGTELLPALKRALALPRSEGVSRSVIIATDGYVSVEAEAFDLIRNNLGKANMFAFGIGTSVNRHLIEGMARAGMGEAFVVTRPEEAQARAESLRTLVQTPVLTGIATDFGGFEVYDVEPASVPDVLADRPVVIFGKWRGKAQGTITITGMTGEGEYRESLDAASVKPQESNSALRYLWARHRIAMLADYNLMRQDDKRVKEITELGLAYNLLTSYTSFIAVDSEIRNKDGRSTTVKQPLPLPEGVSDYAVGSPALAAAPMQSMMYKARSRGYAAAEPEMKEELSLELSDAKGGPFSPGSAAPKAPARSSLKAIRIADVLAVGPLAKEAVLLSAERQVKGLQTCVGTAGTGGMIRIRLAVDAKGAVKKVEILSSRIKDKSLRQCLVRALRTWKFDAASAGETRVEITIEIE